MSSTTPESLHDKLALFERQIKLVTAKTPSSQPSPSNDQPQQPQLQSALNPPPSVTAPAATSAQPSSSHPSQTQVRTSTNAHGKPPARSVLSYPLTSSSSAHVPHVRRVDFQTSKPQAPHADSRTHYQPPASSGNPLNAPASSLAPALPNQPWHVPQRQWAAQRSTTSFMQPPGPHDADPGAQTGIAPPSASSSMPVAGGNDRAQGAHATPSPSHRWHWDGKQWKWVPRDSIPRPKSASSVANNVPIAPTSKSTTFDRASASSITALPSLTTHQQTDAPQKVAKRTAGGAIWKDETLQEWPEDDHRLFVGDLGPDASDADLKDAFMNYPSFKMARVVKDKRTASCRGFGFVSFASAHDMLTAIREMNGKYVGSRPVKLRRSTWQKRSLNSDKWKQVRAFRTISKR